MPARPISWIVPLVSKAELVVDDMGSVHVRVQLLKVGSKEFSWRNSISEREKRKPPENQLVESRTHCVPSHETLMVNQMDVVSA